MKKVIAVLCLLALAAGLSACGNKDGGDTPADGTAGDFCVAVGEAPDGLNPFAAESGISAELFRLVYDPLWRMNEEHQPENCLVDSYDTSSDGLTWTIRLRQDVTFSDGTPLKSTDVKFSWELFRQYSADEARRFDGIVSIKCPDDWTVVITTSFVKGDMMYGEVPILPEHIWSAYSDAPASMDNRAMIGSGPFVYRAPELAPGETQQEWALEARADYFAGRAKLQTLRFRCYESAVSAADALADGLVDACMDLTDVQLFSLSGSYGVESFAVQGPGRGWCELMMNMSSGALADSVVREAILYGLDREQIFSMGFGSVGVYGDGFIEPGSPFYLGAPTRYGFDLTKSAALLASSLYQDYDGDDVLESRDNTMQLSFTLYSTDDVWATAAATIFVRDMAEIGIEIDWTTLSESELRSRCRADGEWDLCLLRRSGSFDPQDEARLYAGGASESGWQSEEYDALYAQLVNCIDPVQKAELCRSLQNAFIDSYPGAVLGYGSSVQAIRADRWTGYEALERSLGGLFGTGCCRIYMELAPAGSETEEPAAEQTSPEPAVPDGDEASSGAETPQPMATAVPLG